MVSDSVDVKEVAIAVVLIAISFPKRTFSLRVTSLTT
jgi:hypothetical protein